MFCILKLVVKFYIQVVVDRIPVVYMCVSHFYITQVYAPTESHTEEELEEFYEDLDEALTNHKGQIIFIMGDFNCGVGVKKGDEETLMGPYGIDVRNKRGEKIKSIRGGKQSLHP